MKPEPEMAEVDGTCRKTKRDGQRCREWSRRVRATAFFMTQRCRRRGRRLSGEVSAVFDTRFACRGLPGLLRRAHWSLRCAAASPCFPPSHSQSGLKSGRKKVRVLRTNPRSAWSVCTEGRGGNDIG
jgi:hypothetical protein